MSFWESSFLWREAVIAACVMGAACGVVGVYMVMRRVVFLPAALSQVSGFGVMFAFLLPTLFASAAGQVWARPETVAIAITVVASLLLGWMAEPRTLSRDALLGIAYIVASAFIVVIGDKVVQESHEMQDVLFGNAVIVDPKQMIIAVVVAVCVLAIHAVLMRSFLLVSIDPATAQAHGIVVSRVDAWLFLTVGVTVAVATKTIGAMPVFAFAVLPAVAALQMFSNMRHILVASALIGAASAFVGYWVSFTASIPTGSCMAVVCALWLVPALLVGRWRRSKAPR